MDSIISLGQKNTLAEYMILSGADNRPPMLDKDLERSSDQIGRALQRTLIRTKKYANCFWLRKFKAIVDMKATNNMLKLPADI
ncbi:hypothetical protein Tco_0858922 [Tanacetum coccineum]|uniref:Uncharacterized protein n=1 Tax=Tanacetum coccineum TaxID=301880 RepID=A0ABQ5BAI9_9ASTR